MGRLIDTEEVNPYLKYKNKDGVNLEGVSTLFNDYFDTLPKEYQDMILITEGMDTGLRTDPTSRHYNPNSKHISGDALDLRIHDKSGGGHNDELYKYFVNDPILNEMGFTIADTDHGTAPHIHLQFDREDEHNHNEVSNIAGAQPNDYYSYIGVNNNNTPLNTDKEFQEATMDEVYGRNKEENLAKEGSKNQVSPAQLKLLKEKKEREIATELIGGLELGFYSDNQQ
jgi:hypothetical protein